jgi:hypothetical protein
MDKIEITLKSGKWLINGKPYQDLCWVERTFFDEFLIAMRINFEAEKKSNRITNIN